MKSSKLYFFISFLSLFLFSNPSLGFEILPPEKAVNSPSAQPTEKGFSIKRAINKYNPLQLLSIDQDIIINQYQIKQSISFDKKLDDPIRYNFNDSSIEERRIKINVTIKF